MFAKKKLKKNISLLFKKIMYFWLRWVFVATCRFSPAIACGLLIVAASLATERGLQGECASAVTARRFSFSAARGIFLGQGLNPCPMYWQEDS